MWIFPADGGLVVVGRTDDGWQRWFSTDGANWQRSPIHAIDTAERNGAMLWRLVSFNDELVAVLSTERPDQIQVWTSSDGIDWNRIADRADFAFRKASERSALEADVVWGCCGEVTDVRVDDGKLIVEGAPPRGDPCDICGDLPPRTVVIQWSSTDEVHWNRNLVAPNYEYTGLATPIVTASGFVRPRNSSNGDFTQIETSSDGSDWQIAFKTDGRISALHPYSGGFLAVGATSDINPSILVVSSVDGTAWAQEGDPEVEGSIGDFVEFAGQIVAIGTCHPFQPEQQACVWVASLT